MTSERGELLPGVPGQAGTLGSVDWRELSLGALPAEADRDFLEGLGERQLIAIAGLSPHRDLVDNAYQAMRESWKVAMLAAARGSGDSLLREHGDNISLSEASASNTALAPSVLADLAQSQDGWIRALAWQNPSTPAWAVQEGLLRESTRASVVWWDEPLWWAEVAAQVAFEHPELTEILLDIVGPRDRTSVLALGVLSDESAEARSTTWLSSTRAWAMNPSVPSRLVPSSMRRERDLLDGVLEGRSVGLAVSEASWDDVVVLGSVASAPVDAFLANKNPEAFCWAVISRMRGVDGIDVSLCPPRPVLSRVIEIAPWCWPLVSAICLLSASAAGTGWWNRAPLAFPPALRVGSELGWLRGANREALSREWRLGDAWNAIRSALVERNTREAFSSLLVESGPEMRDVCDRAEAAVLLLRADRC